MGQILYSEYLAAKTSVENLLTTVGITPAWEYAPTAANTENILAASINELYNITVGEAKNRVDASLSEGCPSHNVNNYAARNETKYNTVYSGNEGTWNGSYNNGRDGTYYGTNYTGWRGGNRSYNSTYKSAQYLVYWH